MPNLQTREHPRIGRESDDEVYSTGEDPRRLAWRAKRATSTLAKFASPKIPRSWTEQRRCNTPFIKCACQICTLHTFRRRKMRQTLQFGGLSVWHLDCGTALRPV